MSEQIIFMYRRRGFKGWATCDETRYFELNSHKSFEVMTAVPAPVYVDLQCERDNLEQHLIKVQETGAEAYWNAIENMEAFQLKRVKAGKSAGCTGSLCDGMAWVYAELECVEAERERLRAELVALKAQEHLVNQPPTTEPAAL